MAIKVRFDNNGWYHPAYGRLGRGKNAGLVYRLPDMFGEKETIKVPVMDRTAKPPKQIAEKEVTRFKYLPETAEVLDDEAWEDLVEEAKDAGEDPPKTVKPTASELVDGDPEQVAGRGREPKAQDAQERTTGTSSKRPARRKAVRA